MINNQLIIIGGGPSIQLGIEQGLIDKIKWLFTLGTNYSYRYFNSTALTFVDSTFYEIGSCTFTGKEVLAHRQALKRQQLIIGASYNQPAKLDNTIFVPSRGKHSRDISTGIYTPWLCGALALTLGVALMKDIPDSEIFLLGFDFGEMRKERYEEEINEFNRRKISKLDKDGNYVTHFYDDIKHKGTGKISHFNQHDKARKVFGPYKEEKDVKIYNVCPTSKIPSDIFNKINYQEFFDKLTNPISSQEELRKEIKICLKRAGF